MHSFLFSVGCLLAGVGLSGCVDRYEPRINPTVNVIVVDGTVTDLDETQVIRLNRSQADAKTGRFGTSPLTSVRVEVVVDSSQVLTLKEVSPGTYQLPDGFRGRVGHRYQLRFELPDGTRYESSGETLPAAPPIERVRARFNPQSLVPDSSDAYTAGHDFFLDTQDPAGARNFYRWDWTLYEKQEWCRSCYQSVYAVNTILANTFYLDDQNREYFVSGPGLMEDCFTPLQRPNDFRQEVIQRYITGSHYFYDYTCRTACWEIIQSSDLNLFDDIYTDGGPIMARTVARVPFFQRRAALVEIRQSALTAEAYRFFKLVQDQTQNNGGLADTPPTALVGNVRNVANPREYVVGYFAATGVATLRYWLDRKDATGKSMGNQNEFTPPLEGVEELFVALNRRRPTPEPPPPYVANRFPPSILIHGGPPRVPSALCVPSDSRTPIKPEGWRE